MKRIGILMAVFSLACPQAGLLAQDQIAQLPAAVIPPDPSAENPAGEAPRGVRNLSDLSESTWVETVDMERGETTIVAGRSRLMRLQRKIVRVSVSNPEIVDAVIISPREILLNAKIEGAVNIILWDHLNEVTVFDVTVTKDPNLLQTVLNRISPDSNFEVFPSNEVFVIKGEVASVSEQQEVEQAANAFAEGSVSLVRVKEAKQILLKIRFIELNHTQGLDFGLDVEYDQDSESASVLTRLLPGGTSASTSGDSTGNFSRVSPFDIFDRNDEDTYQIGFFQDGRAIMGYLKAIEAEGVGKVIARPNLLASDGQEASFLVGGEAAVVAISADNVGVEYREFGTRLTFTPRILPNGKIRLNVAPEVSSLDFANGVTVNDVIIPSFNTIRTSTVVELGNGESFMIGGLLQQKLTITDSGVPGLRNLPLIGKLFDNTDHTYQDTELLVVVTPILLTPDKNLDRAGTPENELFEKATQFMPFPGADDQQDAIEQLMKKTGASPFLKNRSAETIAAGEVWNSQPKSAPVQLAQAPGIDALDRLKSDLQWDALSSVSKTAGAVENVA